jgi:predicted nucleotidyltransferase
MMFHNLHKAEEYSTQKTAILRQELLRLGLPTTISVVTTGSFARKEASEQSDLDFFLLVDNKGMLVDHDYIVEIQQTISGIVRKVIGKQPSPDGAFGAYESTDRMLINIGGNSDENDKITRRILLLLECNWLSNQELFDATRGRLLSRYVDNNIRHDNITRFLLNDIIRYLACTRFG